MFKSSLEGRFTARERRLEQEGASQSGVAIPTQSLSLLLTFACELTERWGNDVVFFFFF